MVAAVAATPVALRGTTAQVYHMDPRLWSDKYHKPASVDVELATPTVRMERSISPASPWSSASDHGVRFLDPELQKPATPECVHKLCQQGQVRAAVEALEVLVEVSSGISKFLLYSVLKECVRNKNLMLGGRVHALTVKLGFGSDTFLCNHLVRMYASHGKLQEALHVFRSVVLPDAFMWSSIISAHVKQGQPQQAIQLYKDMRASLMKPDRHVFVSALQACAAARDLHSGQHVHHDLLASGVGLNSFTCTSLVDMYAKCGSLVEAREVFDRLSVRNVTTWNAMIAGYAKEGMGQEALSLYNAMQNEGMVNPDATTFALLLLACANVGVAALERGKQLHSHLRNLGLEFDVVVGGSLVNMYVKCGRLKDARSVFDALAAKNVVTWTTMIAGYAQQEGMGQEALKIYSAMCNEGMAAPNAVTFVCLLQAVASVGPSALEQGRQLHLKVKDGGYESDVVVGGSLVHMYAKCGSLNDARMIFDGLFEKSVVTWNSMISGYARQGLGQKALEVYAMMQQHGMSRADRVTYVCLLEACASVGALQQGRRLHTEVREVGLECDEVIATCLVKMYAKCGRVEVSRDVFDRLATKSLVTWNALLKGYAEDGEGVMAIKCFQELLEQGVQPNEVTYTCLFTACGQAGLVDQGLQYFESMVERHGVQPDAQHYSCMVDLLGRSGQLQKAEQMLLARGGAGDGVSWTALLSACKCYGDAELGRRCFDHLVNLEPTVSTPYLLLGSIHANAGRWDEVERVERQRKAAGARKMPAKACIEVKEEVHEFIVGEDRSDVAATLRRLCTSVKESGHVPRTQLVLREASHQEKEAALCGHAEKLALAYGLLSTPDGFPLVVTKNLRMCDDCHSSTKVMSSLEKREIVVRDSHKVHRFLNGACSCKDRP